MGAFIFISVLILIICILLILVVLVQNSKGGGLASNFSGSNQIMGVRKTADFLEKTTWTLAIALLTLSLATIFVIPRGVTKTTTGTELQGKIDENATPVANPPASAPAKED